VVNKVEYNRPIEQDSVETRLICGGIRMRLF